MRCIGAWGAIIIIAVSFTSCTTKENFGQTGLEKPVESSQGLKKPSEPQSIKKEIDVPYTPAIYQNLVEQYKVSEDLSNIENLSRFGQLSNEQKKLLLNNAFFVSPSREEQLFNIYEKNAGLMIPSFITTDSIIQAYGLFLDYSQLTAEKDFMVYTMEDFTQSMLRKSIYLYELVTDLNLKTCLLKNIAYFGTAQLALLRELPENMPKAARTLAEEEYALIQNEWGRRKSNIFPFSIDYGMFRPEGHYISGDLRRYYEALTWYSITPFHLYINREEMDRDKEQTLRAILITYALFMDGDDVDAQKWEQLYETQSLFEGKPEYLSIYEYKDMVDKIYGVNPGIESFKDEKKLDSFFDKAEKLIENETVPLKISSDTSSDVQFMLLGHGSVPDSAVFTKLYDTVKYPSPSGLDVMETLGSQRAYEIKMEGNDRIEYPKLIESLKGTFLDIPESMWMSNKYYSWLWIIKSFSKTYGSGYPSFMNNTAWQDKSLNTALGIWSKIHMDSSLNSEEIPQKTAASGEQKTIGYVEPSIETYGKLQWLTRYIKENFRKRNMLISDFSNIISDFDDLLSFLTECSVKELRNEKLTDEEYMKISNYGDTLRNLSALLTCGGVDKKETKAENMISVSNIYNSSFKGSYLHAGLGQAGEIYVVVPLEGKLYLTRGGIFRYYEYFDKYGQKFTCEDWQYMIEDTGEIKRPSWTDSFVTKNTVSITKPNISQKP